MQISTTAITITGLTIAVGTVIFGTLIKADDTILLSGLGLGHSLLIWAAFRKEPDNAHLRP